VHHIRIIGKSNCYEKKVSPIDKHVGTRMRMRRLMLDMSQSQVAHALGLTFQQVQKYEKGTNRISASRLQHLCKILDVPVSFFFDGAPRTDGLPDPAEVAIEAAAAALNSFLATSDGLARRRRIDRSIVHRSVRAADRGAVLAPAPDQRTAQPKPRLERAKTDGSESQWPSIMLDVRRRAPRLRHFV
jgi:transcriptional regulator with XRE-family HTH domain